jgi:hypothetical protein
MEIRYGVVGEIVGGIYADWYIFIQEFHSGEFVLVHTSTHPQTHLPDVKSYDNWFQYRAHIAGELEYWGVSEIIWREDLQSNLPHYAD